MNLVQRLGAYSILGRLYGWFFLKKEKLRFICRIPPPPPGFVCRNPEMNCVWFCLINYNVEIIQHTGGGVENDIQYILFCF